MTSKFRKPTPAYPGSPITWLRKVEQQHSRGAQVDTDVPCGDCNACCHGVSVFLEPDEVDQYRSVNDTDDEGRSRPRLERAPDGSCVYLDDTGACSIYEQRPVLCRGFDCRTMAYCGIRLEGLDKLNEGLEHWNLTPRTAQDREVLLALSLCRKLFEKWDLQADVASAMYFAMLKDARPLAKATLRNNLAAVAQAENTLVQKWLPRVTKAAAQN